MNSTPLTLLFLSAFAIEAPAQDQDKTKQNLIVIMADDLGYGDLGC